MSDVDIFNIAINVINRAHTYSKVLQSSRVRWYVSHTIYPIQSGKPSIPTPHSSQYERAQAFRIGASQTLNLVGMTQKGSQRGVVLLS
jgi:hypothetical protein